MCALLSDQIGWSASGPSRNPAIFFGHHAPLYHDDHDDDENDDAADDDDDDDDDEEDDDDHLHDDAKDVDDDNDDGYYDDDYLWTSLGLLLFRMFWSNTVANSSLAKNWTRPQDCTEKPYVMGPELTEWITMFYNCQKGPR